jgi:hypothetical protein
MLLNDDQYDALIELLEAMEAGDEGDQPDQTPGADPSAVDQESG